MSIFDRFRSWLNRRRWERDNADALAEHQARFELENPDGPPLSTADIDGFKQWYEGQKLTAIELSVSPNGNVRSSGTRLGGPVCLPAGAAWPTMADGTPMEFIAQLDFGELPTLAGYPEQGLLQFFIGSDDLFGADFDDPTVSTTTLFWHETPPPDGSLASPPPPGANTCSPFQDETSRNVGLPLTGTVAEQGPTPSNWTVDARLRGWLRRPGIDEIDKFLEDRWEADLPMVHHIGGFPAFTQNDFRNEARFGDYTHVLLRLTSDDHIMWGDVGEAVFMVTAADLAAQDFSRVAFSWDCH